jgi:hypothetical protein
MKHMNELEQRLEQASQEVRQAAGSSVPPPTVDKGRFAPRGWLVFAAALGAVILVVGVSSPFLPVGRPRPDRRPNSSDHPGGDVHNLACPDDDPAPAADCSAAGLPKPNDQDGVPAPVAEARQAMAAAAIACDYEALAAWAGLDLNTSFGGGGFDNIPMWEEEGTYPALELLVKLFGTPFVVQNFEDSPPYYVWPSAFIYDSWDEIPATDLEALLSIYTQEDLDQYAEFGSYALWRIGITEDGEWKFFVAGD